MKRGTHLAFAVMILGAMIGWQAGVAIAFAFLFVGLAIAALANFVAFRAREPNLVFQPAVAACLFIGSVGLAIVMVVAALTE